MASSGNFLRLRGRSAAVPSDYPPGVIAKGLQAVWDLQTTAGIKLPTNKVVGVDALPPGFGLNGRKIFAPASGTHAFSRYDLSGHTLYAEDNVTINVDNCRFAASPAGDPLNTQVLIVTPPGDTGLATVNATSCTFDLSGNDSVRESPIQNGGILNINDCRMNDCARDFISSVGPGDPGTWDATPQEALTVTDSYLGSFGQRSGPGAHFEMIHAHLGAMTLTRVFFDGREEISVEDGLTGIVYPQARLGPLTWSMQNCISIGTAPTFSGPWNMQFSNNPDQAQPNNFGVMDDNVMQSGLSGYLNKGTSVLSGSGNVDWQTAALITDGGLT